MTVHAVHDWLRRFKEGGLEGMKDRTGRGRKTCLPRSAEATFKKEVLKVKEQKTGGHITAHEIKPLLREKFNVDCSLSTIYRTLHRIKHS